MENQNRTERLKEAVRRATETFDYRFNLKRILKELDHSESICGKTGQPYKRVKEYVDTIGKYGALSGIRGIEVRCSECGYVLGYEGSVWVS